MGEAFSEGVALLRSRLENDGRRLRDCIPIYRALSVNRQAALLSFTCNCGPRWSGAQGFDTLSKAGLRRRRKAEGASGAPPPIRGARHHLIG